MKVLIALINCHSRLAYANAQRETWIPLVPPGVDYKFFLGKAERDPLPDEVFLDCDDSYQGLPNKVQEVVRWALAHGYDFMLKCDDDVVLLPDRFLKSGFDNYDFGGNTNTDKGWVVVPWGFCYTLSKRAMEIVASEPLPLNNNDEAWVACTLIQHGIRLHQDKRYHLHRGRRQDFIIDKRRPIRAPHSRVYSVPLSSVEGTFAWCLYICWLGYRTLSEEKNIAEFKRVFAEETGSGRV